MPFLESAAYFLLLLGGLIFFHELGHFVVARLMGVHVMTFSIGFGPPILRFKGRKTGPAPPTEYVIAALPFGGYVRMLGDDPAEDLPDHLRTVSFNHKAVWRRFLIVAAGPVFNLVLPYFILFGSGIIQTHEGPSSVGMVDEIGPAGQAGLQPGDSVVSIDGDAVSYWYELQDIISARPEEHLTVEVLRDGHEGPVALEVTPRRHREQLMAGLDVTHETGRIGIVNSYLRPYVAVVAGSPAHAAGLRTGDQVTAVNGSALKTHDQLLQAIDASPGAPVTLSYSRHALREDIGTTGAATAGTEGEATIPATGTLKHRGVASLDCVVEDVWEGSPAETIGLVAGDVILALDDNTCRVWSFFHSRLSAERTTSHTLAWAHGDLIRTASHDDWIGLISPDPKRHPDLKQETVGVRQVRGIFRTPERIAITNRLGYAVSYSIFETHRSIVMNVATVVGLLRGAVPVSELSGPVGIAVLVSKTSEYGWGYFFQLMVWLSISLGLINLLPIPVLDGGHIMFLGIEAIRRRPVSLRTRQIATYIGLAFIILLMVAVIKFDIERPWS